MRFFIFFFQKFILRPSSLILYNLFFLRRTLHLLSSSLLYPHIFINVKNNLKLKIFKFTLTSTILKVVWLSFITVLAYFAFITI